jgi:hypothetical protein
MLPSPRYPSATVTPKLSKQASDVSLVITHKINLQKEEMHIRMKSTANFPNIKNLPYQKPIPPCYSNSLRTKHIALAPTQNKMYNINKQKEKGY